MKTKIQNQITVKEGAFTASEEVGFFQSKVGGEINIFANSLSSLFIKETDDIKVLKARVAWLKKIRVTIKQLEREREKLFF